MDFCTQMTKEQFPNMSVCVGGGWALGFYLGAPSVTLTMVVIVGKDAGIAALSRRPLCVWA